MAMFGRCLALAFLLTASTVEIQGQAVDVVPRELTVLPGRNASILCRVGYTLGHCRVEIPGHKSYILKPGDGENGVSYYGSGLQNGECGATIDRAREENNGLVRCTMPPQSGLSELVGTMKLTVAKAPSPPVLEVSRGTESATAYRVNDDFNARCFVQDGRPAAKISWYIDNEPLYDGLHQPTIYDTPGSDLQTSAQNLTRRLQIGDNGRVLKCVAEHIALQDGRDNVAQRQLEVKYMPQAREDPIGIFGIKIGDHGLINVTVRAHPAPGLEWIVDGSTITAGSVDNTGRIEAALAQPLGDGYYNATLRIATVTREDTERNYLLKAHNDQGLQEYNIRISTMDEPQGVELDVGSIVGIVVAVLVLLIIVFLIIFAKVTKRWCFGGPSRNEPKTKKNSGESSDTESASGHRQDRIAAAKARATAGLNRAINLGREILPSRGKNKDKVAQAEVDEPKNVQAGDEAKAFQQETQIPVQVTQVPAQLTQAPEQAGQQTQAPQEARSDAGIVYAELSLKPGVNQPRPPLDKTEYAEIIYNNEQKEVKKPE